MKVLVVGSKRHMDGARETECAKFDEACRQLGKSFTERGHTLIVGTDDQIDADYHFVEGANQVPGPHTVVVGRPDTDQRATPYTSEFEKFKNIQFRYRPRRGEWTVVQVYALSEADVVVVIGGRTTAAATGYSAGALKTPVLAVASFGGAAREVWSEVQRYYAQCGVSDDDKGTLNEAWSSRSAEVAVRCAESLVRRRPFHPDGGRGAQIGMMIATLFLIAAWVALFRRPMDIGRDIAFYSMLTIAALLGTSLRSTLRLVRDDLAHFDSRILLNEATAGILISFGFALLYLAGGIVISGNVVSLDKPADFTRIAISMSILGFAAAFLLNEAAASLQDRFTATLKARDPDVR
jgi:hypothetical protein